MATLWSALTAFALIVSATSYSIAIYPSRTGKGALRSLAGMAMIGFGLLTLFALKMAQDAH